MENDPKTVSNESVLMNPDDDTLVDAENVVVLKQSDTKKRGANIEYEFFCSYDNYNEFVEKIVRGEVKGKYLQFKHQNGEKYRFYCRYLSKGCRASLYLQSTEGSSGHCFVSIDDHSNHPEQEREKIEDRLMLRIKELEQLGVKDTSRPNKRAKTVEVEANSENANVNCKKCNEPMKKRRYYYCINKCTQD